jgi:serine/threonine-protein kinase HipA
MRKAEIKINGITAGWLTQEDLGYQFIYTTEYLQMENAAAVSLTLPLQSKPYLNTVLFPFFDGLIPEGWLLDIAEKNWKLNSRDRMGLLLTCCEDCIGAVSVYEVMEEDHV